MSSSRDEPACAPRAMAGVLLMTGIILTAFADAVSGTLPALGRADMSGDLATTPDEFAWLDIVHTTARIMGFAAAPWLVSRVRPTDVVVAASLILATASGLAGLIINLETQAILRSVQGLAGGALLVAGQSIVFWVFPRAHQPLLQAVFAAGAVVAPGTIAPAFQGWIIDVWSWEWVFITVVAIGALAAGLIILSGVAVQRVRPTRPFDLIGFALLSMAVLPLTFVLSQGSRWDWLASERIVLGLTAAVLACAAFLVRQQRSGSQALLQTSAFATETFAFAFVISFVAGAALFGSAFVLPAFLTGVLGYTPLSAGSLLLPGSLPFLAALIVAAILVQKAKLPGLVLVPIGILMVMSAMWLLAQSNLQSGSGDMTLPLQIRGFGLGLMFLALTLMAFGQLRGAEVASGIAFFNIGRQLGGLMGVAGLQTLIDHRVALSSSVLGTYVTSGVTGVSERLAATSAALMARGLDAAPAANAARALLNRALGQQASIIAFDTAFATLALMFIAAVPILVCVKIGLSIIARRARQPVAV
ncbi:MFS transporter [Microvirga terrae]|uniref:MFS transporter n=2 Tax=Microvirga TaxID=186650 RepID=A0ABY5RQC7_9HYPH|nr:MFS transporter [Microvirga terrae]UVF18992.1 MFS transporter [Microvirga terrae]